MPADSSWEGFSRRDARFSRDGTWIYFTSDRTGQSQIWKVPTDPSRGGGHCIQVTRSGAVPLDNGANGKESLDGSAHSILYVEAPQAQTLNIMLVENFR